MAHRAQKSLANPDDGLQAAGDRLLAVLAGGEDCASEAGEMVERLHIRDWEGDDVLADEIVAAVQGTQLPGRRLPIALDELASALETDPMEGSGLLDLQLGEVVPGPLTDPMVVGEEYAIDVEEDPDRWLGLPPPDSRDSWRDMALFAERADPPLRDQLERALHGRGAFRYFKDVLARAGLLEEFFAFTDDRQRGRARQFLADHGIRVQAAPAVGGAA